jgi:c(7)-type cytochrome triheme protein
VKTTGKNPLLLAMLLAALAIPAAAADGLKNLPGPLPLPSSDGSPGKVTFRHSSHVDAKQPACTRCHPKLFSSLKARDPAAKPITHKSMEAGDSCGACHAKTAFNFDSCDMCHGS